MLGGCDGKARTSLLGDSSAKARAAFMAVVARTREFLVAVIARPRATFVAVAVVLGHQCWEAVVVRLEHPS